MTALLVVGILLLSHLYSSVKLEAQLSMTGLGLLGDYSDVKQNIKRSTK